MNSTKQAATIRIGNRSIGDGQPCFVIAEIGNNHNGNFDRAIALVDAAVAASADCAKFQMRKLDEVYRASSLSGKDDDLAVEYTLDLLRLLRVVREQAEIIHQRRDAQHTPDCRSPRRRSGPRVTSSRSPPRKLRVGHSWRT